MKCTACGSKNKDGLAFCENCGNPLTAVKPKLVKKTDTSHCPNCHEEVKPGLKFCENCGEPLASIKLPAMMDASSKQCPNCHAQIQTGLKFCENCGYQLLADTQDKETPIRIKPKRVLPKVNLRDKLSHLSGAIRTNPYRAILIALCLIAIIFGSVWGIDRLGNPVSRNQADGMAQGIVSAIFPQLADVKPHISVFKQADHNVVSYNYSKQIDVELADGNITKTTAGLIINVDRKTGEVTLVQFP